MNVRSTQLAITDDRKRASLSITLEIGPDQTLLRRWFFDLATGHMLSLFTEVKGAAK